MNKITLICFVLLAFISLIKADNDKTKSVTNSTDIQLLELTYENFETTTDNNDIFLIYEAEKCQPCKNFRPLFIEVASEMKKIHPDLVVANLDVDLYAKLFTRLEAKHKGIIRLIKKGDSPGFPYTSLGTKEHLTTWFNKFIAPSLSHELKSLNELEEFIKGNQSIIYLGNRQAKSFYDTFIDLSKTSYEVKFGDCNSEDCINHYNIEKESLIFVKNGKITVLKPEYDLLAAEKFLSYQSLDEVTDSSPINIKKLEFLGITALVIYKRKDSDSSEYEKMLRDIINERKSVKNTNGELSKQTLNGVITEVLEVYNPLQGRTRAKESEAPSAYIIEFAKDDARKYKLDDNDVIDKDSLTNFISQWENGKLKPYFYSDDLPEEETEQGIVKVVGKNFDKVIYKNNKDVMLFIHDPHCGYCKQFTPIYEGLRRKLRNNKNLILAKVDAANNELPKNIKSSGYPTILFWKGNNKKNYIEYTGERQIYLLVSFIEKNGAYVNKEDEL